MKRKKLSEKASLFTEGSFDPPDVSKSEQSYLVRSLRPKFLLFLAAITCFLETGRAESTPCPAGYYCVQHLEFECQEGLFSREGEDKCTPCPHGYFCPNASDEPLKCEEGYYSRGGSTECLICPAGYTCNLSGNSTEVVTCKAGTYSVEGGNECLPTPKGYMTTSPSGKPKECTDGYYTENDNSTSCKICPRGHHCEFKDQVPTICEEGTFAGMGKTKCESCPIGYKCERGCSRPTLCHRDDVDCHHPTQRRGLAVAGDCVAGQYFDGYDTCRTCPEGYECPTPANAPVECGAGEISAGGTDTCTTCAATQICPSKRASEAYYCSTGYKSEGNLYCKPCSDGHVCDGSTTETACVNNSTYSPGGIIDTCIACPTDHECNIYTYIHCTEGFYLNANRLCEKCNQGNYCQDNNQYACPTGTYQPFDGFTYCFECPVQAECPNTGMTDYTLCAHDDGWAYPGSAACTSCSLNRECFVGYEVDCPSNYYSIVGDYECHPCPAGSSCNAANPTIQSACGAGTYSPVGGMDCWTCPTGHMCPSNLMEKPTPCPAGFDQSSTGQTSCNPCVDGTFSNIPGATNCLALPAGHYSNADHSASIPCPKGTYVSADSQSCSECSGGYLCGIGEPADSQAHSVCPIGYYCPQTGTEVVQRPCAAGKYGTSEGAATEAAGCTDCPNGYFCPGGPAIPISCPEGAICALGAAVPSLCPDGTYNKFKGKSAGGDCIACAAGEYCPAGSAWPLDCPAGMYCGAGDTSGTQCNAGTYLPLNNVPDSPSTTQADCQACPLGHYCEAGASNPTPCPPGRYRDTTGATQLTDCAQCPTGVACPFSGISDINSAVACDYGHYCPIESTYPHANPCPAGKFSDATNLADSSGCGNCPAGYFCDAGSNSFTNPPTICPAGYFCPQDSASGTANPCPAGTYSTNTGLTVSTECIQCPAGSYCTAGTTAVAGLCDPGHWCPAGSSTATENACPAGTYSAGTGLKTENECTVCPLGSICSSTAMLAPVNCPAGTYGAAAGLDGSTTALSCTTCPEGHFCAEGVTTPTVCGRGMWSNAGAMDTGAIVCEKCPTGSYCALEATTPADVTACDAGFICDVAGAVGVPEVPFHPDYSCPAGQYCGAGATAGTNCPTGTYNPTAGKGLSTDCITVPAGFYADTEGTVSIDTNVCPAGYYCLAGATDARTNPCPAGFYRGLTGGTQLSDCGICPAGFYCGENTVTPIDCPQGYYCIEGVSDPVKCPKGYYGANTGLSAVGFCTICPQGRYCSQAGLSEPDGLCDPGFTCGEGSTSPAPPTRRNLQTSTSGVCPAGGYCEQGSVYATRCPPGTFNDQPGQDEASDCIACTDGHYCVGTTDPSTSGQCLDGYYCNNNSTSSTQFFADQGKFSVAGDSIDTDCAIGTYNPFFAQSACLPCVAGYY